MKCSIQLGFASLNRTFHLSPHENNCTIALITIHYLYNVTPTYDIERSLVSKVGHRGHPAHVHVAIVLFLRSESQLTRAHFSIMVTIFCVVSQTISDGAAISCPSQRHGRVTAAAGFTRQRDVRVDTHMTTLAGSST